MITPSGRAFALKTDCTLLGVAAIGFFLSRSLGFALAPVPFWVTVLCLVAVAHLILTLKIIVPLRHFTEIADSIADGEPATDLDRLKFGAMSDVQGSFTKIVGSLIESREAIENYMQKISDINKELEQKVDSLSVLYAASKTMGDSLNVDTLTRTLLTLFIDRVHVTGACILLYSDRTDLVNVKDLLGLPPELFARFRFYSDHMIVTSSFAQEDGWFPDDSTINLLTAEFDTDAIRSLAAFFPLRIKDHFVGLVGLGPKRDGSAYDHNDRELLLALMGLASTSINNSSLYEHSEATKNELDRKVFNLMTLQQSGKVLSSTLNLDKLIQIAIDMFIETFWTNRGVLMLLTEDLSTLEVKAAKGLDQEEIDSLLQNPSEVWVMTTLQKERRPVLAQELASNTSYQSYMTINRPLPFALYLPLLKEGELYGVVKIGSKINGEAFTENDLEFFTTLSSQAVIAFENARLYSLAITDSITKLYVHRYFQLRLEEEVSRSMRYNSTLSLLMCDIDNFKAVNDHYGHQQGDTMLREISQILRRNIRSTDIAARYGGEEFVIILPETTQSDARIVAERIRRDTSRHEFPAVASGQPALHCTISIGVAGFPLNATSKDELIQKADSSMYLAKQLGRNRVILCGASE